MNSYHRFYGNDPLTGGLWFSRSCTSNQSLMAPCLGTPPVVGWTVLGQFQEGSYQRGEGLTTLGNPEGSPI